MTSLVYRVELHWGGSTTHTVTASNEDEAVELAIEAAYAEGVLDPPDAHARLLEVKDAGDDEQARIALEVVATTERQLKQLQEHGVRRLRYAVPPEVEHPEVVDTMLTKKLGARIGNGYIEVAG